MNILESMKGNVIAKYLLIAVLIINMIPVALAIGTTGTASISSALKELCLMSQTFLGLVAMVLIVLAGATYAIGQVLGAETRARAAVWATAMLTGAMIGIIIYLVTPTLVAFLLGQAAPTTPCDFTFT